MTALGEACSWRPGATPPLLTVILLVCIGEAPWEAGGANALNHFLDKDIDGLMTRTAQRPVASGNRISPHDGPGLRHFAEHSGRLLHPRSTGSTWLAAALTLAATLFYVFVYTGWLKRSSSQNIVIGGAAGSHTRRRWAGLQSPAVFDVPALYLFAIIFFWTPPHFWALSLLIQRDYERAGVPMLPVVAGEQKTVENIFAYSLVLVALTLVFAATGAVGGVYLGAAAILGAVFIWAAWRLWRGQTRQKARNLYLYSLLYLALLFGAMMADGVYRVL